MMKKNPFVLNILLTAVLFGAMAVCMVVRALYPAVNLPSLDIPNMVLLSLIALLLHHLLGGEEVTCWACSAVLAVAAFALLPLMAGFACWHTFWEYGLVGGTVFTVTGLLFSSVRQRIASGVEARGALVATAFGIYLAAQAFAAMVL